MTATDTTTPGAVPAPGSDEYHPWPKWQRRAVIAVVLVVAVTVLVLAGRRNQVGQALKDRDPVVVVQLPPPGGRALRQTEVGAELKVGYDGRLTINGTPIPEEQMSGAIDPTTVSAQELRQFGIRPNKRNSVYFQPGPGKVIESFDTGPVTIALRYFKDRQATTTGRTISWTISVD
ncbi:MAG: hypothetical protein ACR2MB_01880 [Acidimicrobiales bacterium]